MKVLMNQRIWAMGLLIAVFGSIPFASAAGVALSVRTTSLGKIVVNGKGMTAYFYDLDKANSGVSACTGQCLVNWPAITSSSIRPVLIGIKGKVSVLASTKQLAINGRPIYTFIGDTSRGSTKGQGIGGVWFAISPTGVEVKPSAPAAPSTAPALPITPAPITSPSPTTSPTTSTYSYSNY